MAGIREKRREELKARLIAAATGLIEKGGIRSLNAREVTTEAGCALGSLYTVFADIDELVIHVNSATLHRLAETIAAAPRKTDNPVETLKSLARAYLAFARQNLPLWIALFDYAALSGTEIPEWHQREQALLIQHIMGPVEKLSPGLGEADLIVRARTLFAAVHGIVSISLEDRFIGLDKSSLEDELMRFIDQMVAGIAKT